MKKYLGIAVLTMLLAFEANAFGSEKRGRHGERGRGMAKMLKQLELTKEQKEKLKDHRENNKGSKKELRSKIKATKEKMKNAFKSNASDSELRSIHNEIKNLKSEMADARFEKMLFIRGVLTKDQRAKLDEMKEKRRGNRKNKRMKRGQKDNG